MPQGVRQAHPISQNIRFGVCARFLIPVVGIVVLCGGVLGSLIKLQFSRYEDNLKLARQRLRFVQRLMGTRGPIFDIDNNMLAVDKRTCDLYVTPKQFLDSLSVLNHKMSQEKKDELLIRIINRNKPRIKQFITDMALSQGIRMDVKDVSAEKDRTE